MEKCIKSVQKQAYENLEIIFVDDGSPYGCGSICDAYARTDECSRDVHKENGELADSCHKGIDGANGDYIMFVDSDGSIHPRIMKAMLEELEETSTDPGVCSFKPTDDTKIAFEETTAEKKRGESLARQKR